MTTPTTDRPRRPRFGRGASRSRVLRRASDPTLLDGPVRPLTRGAVLAAAVGAVLALIGPSQAQPVAFTLSSVVTVGLLGAARRADTDIRPDHEPDRSLRTRLATAGIVALGLLGTVSSAWTIAADLAR